MHDPLWSLQDAKNSFSAVVEAALKGAPQTVTKRGKLAVVVLSVAEFERLTRRHALPRSSFIDHLLNMPQDDDVPLDRARIRPRSANF